MFPSPRVAVTNCYMFSSLIQYKFILIVHEARNLKSRYWQGRVPSEGAGDSLFLASPSSDYGWHACSCIALISASVFMRLLPSLPYLLSLIRTLFVIKFRVHLGNPG